MHLGAITWEPQIHAIVVVLLAIIILPGSVYLVLGTNLGARIGFLVAAAGLFGWMTIMALVWTIYGIGPPGTPPSWKVKEVVVGDASRATTPAMNGFPTEWKQLPAGNPEVTDAQATVDGELVPPTGSAKKSPANYTSSSDYIAVAAYEKGGQTYFFTLRHRPHYLVVQVQRVKAQATVAGQPPPKSVADPTQPIVSTVMLRDLGSVRLRPATYLLFSLVLFLLLVGVLHVRDKKAMAERAAAGRG